MGSRPRESRQLQEGRPSVGDGLRQRANEGPGHDETLTLDGAGTGLEPEELVHLEGGTGEPRGGLATLGAEDRLAEENRRDLCP